MTEAGKEAEGEGPASTTADAIEAVVEETYAATLDPKRYDALLSAWFEYVGQLPQGGDDQFRVVCQSSETLSHPGERYSYETGRDWRALLGCHGNHQLTWPRRHGKMLVPVALPLLVQQFDLVRVREAVCTPDDDLVDLPFFRQFQLPPGVGFHVGMREAFWRRVAINGPFGWAVPVDTRLADFSIC